MLAIPWPRMAGALRIKLEKVGYYSIGEGYEPIILSENVKPQFL